MDAVTRRLLEATPTIAADAELNRLLQAFAETTWGWIFEEPAPQGHRAELVPRAAEASPSTGFAGGFRPFGPGKQ